jgi:hypothetical protein
MPVVPPQVFGFAARLAPSGRKISVNTLISCRHCPCSGTYGFILSKVYLYYLHSKNIEYFEKLDNLAFENIL